MSSTAEKPEAPNYGALGKVFLSHASSDKKFVRALAKRLNQAGVDVWLDERELIVGDSLSEEVFAAIAKASAVIVVVSESSLKSDWVRHELRAAAMRMIKGECRLIPVVLDDSELPDEMTGLFYADCRPNVKFGTKKILTALAKEAKAQEDIRRKRREREKPTVDHKDSEVRSRGIYFIVEEVFGKVGWASMDVSATRTLNWDEVSIRAEGKEDTGVVLDVVSAYTEFSGNYTVEDWKDWENSVTKDYDVRYGLLITERPLSPHLTVNLKEVAPNVFIQRVPTEWQRSTGALCLVNLEPPVTDEEALERINAAHGALVKAIEEQEDYEPSFLEKALAERAASVKSKSEAP